MDEWTFVRELCERADCWLLFDVNNVFVSSFNHDFDPLKFIDAVPRDRVVQIHLAGHSDHGTHKIDTHDQPVTGDVWSLYAKVCRRFGDVSAMIERDDNFPPFGDLLAWSVPGWSTAKNVRGSGRARHEARPPAKCLPSRGSPGGSRDFAVHFGLPET
jgi:uncharacterized protein (UPF0276 family)